MSILYYITSHGVYIFTLAAVMPDGKVKKMRNDARFFSQMILDENDEIEDSRGNDNGGTRCERGCRDGGICPYAAHLKCVDKSTKFRERHVLSLDPPQCEFIIRLLLVPFHTADNCTRGETQKMQYL